MTGPRYTGRGREISGTFNKSGNILGKIRSQGKRNKMHGFIILLAYKFRLFKV